MENRKHQDFILKELFCAEKLLDGLVASPTANSSEELEERLSPCKLPHFHTFNLKEESEMLLLQCFIENVHLNIKGVDMENMKNV